VDAPYLSSNCGYASKAVYVPQTSLHLSVSDNQPPAWQIIITDTGPWMVSTAAVLPCAQVRLFAHTNKQTDNIYKHMQSKTFNYTTVSTLTTSAGILAPCPESKDTPRVGR
jgi:hypothetical protein